MSREQDNKVIAGQWFAEFWGNPCNLAVVDELAAPDMLLQYSFNARCCGHAAVKSFMQALREAFPDLSIRSAEHLLARGDYVMGRRNGGGTHTGFACGDFPTGAFPTAFGRRMRFTSTTMLQIKNGKVVEETVWTTGLTVFRPLRLIEPSSEEPLRPPGDEPSPVSLVSKPAADRQEMPGEASGSLTQ